jgi:predicted metal-binding protein
METATAYPKARSICAQKDVRQLERDLETLKALALEKGAASAFVVNAKDMPWLENASARSGEEDYSSAHWPLKYPKDSIRDAAAAFEKAIFFVVDTPPRAIDPGQGPIDDKTVRAACKTIYEIAAAVEAAAFYMGHHLTLGFAHANCRAVFCPQEKRCWGEIKGRVCLHPYKARPSMAACGMDSKALAAACGIEDKASANWAAGIVFVD